MEGRREEVRWRGGGKRGDRGGKGREGGGGGGEVRGRR